ncbi:hypothetical protein DB346_03500 [Verrucomicrobia bacterium LW23]|nr:hypothetical protein DB346_03500 [Verrucomicrobia bacterium LW23]
MPNSSSKKVVPARVVVIGAGLGGMAAAARLARMGHRVEIWEKNEVAGGKLRELKLGAYSWDMGPSLLTMPHVLRDLFRFCGVEPTSRLDLIRLPSACRYFFGMGDGPRKGVPVSAAAAGLEPDFIDEDDAFWKLPEVARFLDYARGIYELSGEAYLNYPPAEFWRAFTIGNLPRLKHLPKVCTFETMDQVVRRFFADEAGPGTARAAKLRRIFNRFATYNGSSPYLTPATFNIIPYVEAEFGAWYPRGGMVVIAREIERLAREMGVIFRFGEAVAEFRPHLPTGAAAGEDAAHSPSAAAAGAIAGWIDDLFANTRDESGRDLRSAGGTLVSDTGRTAEVDALICNGDVLRARGGVLRSLTTDAELDTLRDKPLSSSGFILCLGVRKRYPQLRHHNIFFSDNYEREFADIFERKQLPGDPTIYVCISARTDEARAAGERDNYFVLVNAPAWPDDKPLSNNEKRRYRDTVVRRLETLGLTDLSSHIEEEHIFTPKDFASRDLTWQGTLYGWASHSIGAALFRPPMRLSSRQRVWFCGGTTHPGGGIPLVLLSGRMVAESVDATLRG